MHDYILDSTQDKVASKGDKMGKLDVAIKLEGFEVEEEEIELIENGVLPDWAHDRAVKIVAGRRRDKYANKSGG